MPLQRFVFASVLVLGLGTALAAPAEYPVEVGKRVAIRVAHPSGTEPRPGQIVPKLDLRGQNVQVDAKVKQLPDGSLEMQLDLWGDAIPGDLEARVRTAFPELKDAQVTVTSLEGTVRTTQAGKIGHELLDAGKDPAKLEAARREVQARLEAENPGAQVEVQVSPDGREQKVTVKKVK